MTRILFFFLMITLAFSSVQSVQAGVFPNIHEVEKGKLYRSGQLSLQQFKKYIQKWGIKTIINLRGESYGESWYHDELLISDYLGVEHHDISMSASRLPHRDDLIKLLDIFETAERPILVHCKGGADRTGEAVAIYMIDYMGMSKKEAQAKAQSIFTFHIESRFPAKKYFINNIYQGKDWARESYDPCKGYKFYDPQFCPSL